MASRGSNKELSVRQEDFIAKLFDGRRSKTSGAAPTDPGDVRCDRLLIECKMQTPTSQAKPPAWLKQFEKIAQEAWEHSLEPMMAFRWYVPDSPLAGPDGWVDLTVRMAVDDSVREASYNASAQ